jgi:GABA(A) receptor-associated protein
LTKTSGSTLPESDKKKYLVPNDLTVGQLLHVIRKRIKITATDAIFLFTEKNISPATTAQLGQVYAENADPDGFLYMTYNTESTFG